LSPIPNPTALPLRSFPRSGPWGWMSVFSSCRDGNRLDRCGAAEEQKATDRRHDFGSDLAPPRSAAHRRQHDIGGAHARRNLPGRHDAVDAPERLELAAAQWRIGEHLAQRM
jgi:hypothetical protein